MAERLTRDQARQRTRTAILDAAQHAFATRGYRASTLDDIALAAGFTKGAVYSNFASKAELFLALLDRQAEHDRQSAHSLSPAPAADAAWSLATLDFLIEAANDPQVRRALADRYAQARRTTGAQIGQGQEPPEWANWEEVATVAMALGSGLIIQSIIDSDAVPEDLFARTMQTLLGPPGPTPDPAAA